MKNASRKILKRMHDMGVAKAQRLQNIQERWDKGEYEDVEVIQL